MQLKWKFISHTGWRGDKKTQEKKEEIILSKTKMTCLVARISVVYKYSSCHFDDCKLYVLCLLGDMNGLQWLVMLFLLSGRLSSFLNIMFSSDAL